MTTEPTPEREVDVHVKILDNPRLVLSVGAEGDNTIDISSTMPTHEVAGLLRFIASKLDSGEVEMMGDDE